MSKLLQPGRHPDADQLSAFAEQILPDHERLETLAHLAECPDCRGIVFLAQRAQETQDPAADAFPARTRWLRNWHKLWPVAAALTCGLLVIAFVQRRLHVDLLQKADVAFESKTPVLPSQGRSPRPVVAGTLPSGGPPTPKSPVAAKGASSLHPALAVSGPGAGGFSIHGSLPIDHHPTGNMSAFSFNGATAGKTAR
jgi:hypothetical protein